MLARAAEWVGLFSRVNDVEFEGRSIAVDEVFAVGVEVEFQQAEPRRVRLARQLDGHRPRRLVEDKLEVAVGVRLDVTTHVAAPGDRQRRRRESHRDGPSEPEIDWRLEW